MFNHYGEEVKHRMSNYFSNVPYIYVQGDIKLKLDKKIQIFYCCSVNWLWCFKYDNSDMALMLIDILHQKKVINDATYSKIMSKNYQCGKIA